MSPEIQKVLLGRDKIDIFSNLAKIEGPKSQSFIDFILSKLKNVNFGQSEERNFEFFNNLERFEGLKFTFS